MTSAENQALSGINATAYSGVNTDVPVPLYIKDRPPTSDDFQNFGIGTLWVIPGVSGQLWILSKVEQAVATWVKLYPGSGGGGGANSYLCNTGVANQASGVISILGGLGGFSTSGSGSTVTVSLSGSSSQTFDTDSGTATPSLGVIDIVGGSNISTSASGNTVSVAMTANVTVANDLSVDGEFNGISAVVIDDNATFDVDPIISSLSAGVIQSSSSGTLSSSKGTNGQLLISSSSGAPAWNNISSSDGSISIVNGINSIGLASNGSMGNVVASSYFLAYIANNVPISFSTPTFSIGSQGANSIFTIVRNPGSNFFPGNGTSTAAFYTAPSSGTYVFTFQVIFTTAVSHRPTSAWNYIETPSQKYVSLGVPAFVLPTGPVRDGTICCHGNFTVPLTMGDVVNFAVAASPSGTATIFGISPTGIGLAPSGLYTFILGYRIA